MSRIRGSIEIFRPVEEVFDTVADQRNEVHYNPRMTTSAKVTKGPIGVGTTFQATVLHRGRPLDMTIEYTAFDRPRRLTSRSVMAGAVVQGSVRCDPIEGETRLSWDWQLSLSGLARLAGPLVARIGQRQETQIWSGLKHYLEGGPA